MREAELLELINRIEKVRSIPYACQEAVDILTASKDHVAASVHLLDARCDRLDAVAYSKHPPGSFRLPKSGSFLWRTLDKGVVRTVELPCARGYEQGMPQALRALVVPILSGKTRWGLLVAESSNPGDFSEEDALFCRLIASILGTAINQRKMEERLSANLKTLSERNRQNKLLLDVSLELFSCKDRDKLFENFVRSIYTNLGYDKVYLFLRDEPSSPVSLAACRGKAVSAEVIDELLGEEKGLTGRALRTGMPALSNDVTQDPDYFLDDKQTRSEMAVPVKYGETLWGVLVIDEYHKDAFRKEDLQVASILCSHLAVVLDNIEYFRRLERGLELREALHEIVTTAASETDMVSLCSRVALYLREKTKYSLVEIAAVVDERKGWARIIASSRPEAVKPGFLDDRNKMLRQGGGGLTGQAVRTRSIVYAPDVSRSEQYVCLDERTLSEVDVPILFGERLFGVLCAESHRTGAFSEEDIKCLTILARHLGVLWAHLELLDQTMAKSLKDELTGLWNRRFLYEKLNEELDRTRRYKTGFSIVMIDLADFKDVNDKYGHPEGDRVLVEISDYLSRSMRESDSFFRYGGDEFIALLPEAGNAEVMTIMERIEKEMACKTWGEKKVSISADFGTASCPCDGTDAESLIRVADLRLYEAKRKRKFYKNGG